MWKAKEGSSYMNKPLCKVTLQDLLDSIQASEKEGSQVKQPARSQPAAKEESLNDWLSLDEIAEDLNINPDLLYACIDQWEVRDIQSGSALFHNQLYVKH